MSNIGHWGTGDLELTLRTSADLEKAKPARHPHFAHARPTSQLAPGHSANIRIVSNAMQGSFLLSTGGSISSHP